MRQAVRSTTVLVWVLALALGAGLPAAGQPADGGGPAGTTTRQADPVCAATATSDPAEGGTVDIATYAGAHRCASNMVVFTFTTHDSWGPDALSEVYVRIDTDGDVTNGCSEGDFLVYAVNSPDDGSDELTAGVFAVPTCEDLASVGTAEVTVVDQRTVEVRVDRGLLGNPSRMGHYGQLSGVGETNATADYAPDVERVVLAVGPLPDPASAPVCTLDDADDVVRIDGAAEQPVDAPPVDVTQGCLYYGDRLQLDLVLPALDLESLGAGGPAALLDLDLDGTADRVLRALWDGHGIAVTVTEDGEVVCRGRALATGTTLRVGDLPTSCVDDVAELGVQVGMGATLDGATVLDRLGPGGFLPLRRLGPVDPADVGTDPATLTAPDPADRPPAGELVRLAGPARIETAIEVSRHAWPDGAATVVLARQDVEADALAGAPLAAAAGGPILLSPSDGLTVPLALELQRVLPPGGRVHVLGGAAALDDQVVAEVQQLGFGVVRLAGPSRVETGLAIAEATAALRAEVAHIVVADAFEFSSALVAGAAAGAHDGVVVTTAPSGLSADVQAFIDAHPDAQLTAVGPGASSAAPQARSLTGTDAYGTSVMVAQAFFPGASAAVVASGESFPDGLGGGALAGSLGVPLLLSQRDALSNPVTNYLSGGTWGELLALGGEAALGPAVADALAGFID